MRSESVAPDPPRPPRRPVDPRCRGWWATQWAVLFGCGVLTLVVLGILIEPARVLLLTPAVLAAVVGLAISIAAPRVQYRVHRWETTDAAVYVRSGWLWQEWRAAPLSRVQTVDLVRGPIQRGFGLATVTVTTASAKGAVKIEALDSGEAEELVQRLTVLTETSTPEGPDGDDRDAT